MIKEKKTQRRKITPLSNPKTEQKIYDVWEQYNQFVRSLHLEQPIPKIITRRETTANFLKKLIIIALGSFITTATFIFLVKPSGIYNPGLNGLLKKISEWLVELKPGYFNYYYYGSALVINLLIIFCLWFWYRAKLEMMGTAIIYNLFQIVWTCLFETNLVQNNLFTLFSLESWKKIKGEGNNNKLILLPYQVVVAMLAAIFHTYGYSLIFRARATPGGLEIISGHFAAQDQFKFSISFWIRNSSFLLLLITTLFQFYTMRKEEGGGDESYPAFLTSNSGLLATVIYIIVSEITMNYLFPRQQIILCQIYSRSKKNHSQALHLLEKHSPTYYNVYQKGVPKKKKIYVTSCYLSRWNYFLLEPDLKLMGKIYVNETG